MVCVLIFFFHKFLFFLFYIQYLIYLFFFCYFSAFNFILFNCNLVFVLNFSFIIQLILLNFIKIFLFFIYIIFFYCKFYFLFYYFYLFNIILITIKVYFVYLLFINITIIFHLRIRLNVCYTLFTPRDRLRITSIYFYSCSVLFRTLTSHFNGILHQCRPLNQLNNLPHDTHTLTQVRSDICIAYCQPAD